MNAIKNEGELARSRDKRLQKFHNLWLRLDDEERREIIAAIDNAPKRRMRNWIVHLVIITILITIILLAAMPPAKDHHFAFAVIGGYIIALNIFALEWILTHRYKKHD